MDVTPAMNTPPVESEIFPQYFPPRPGIDMPVGNGETILLVDDEEMVRSCVARRLECYRYHVLTAGTGIAAIDLFREHQSDIKLVIADIVMPDMNGAALLHVLRILAPDLAAIAISGYAPSCPAVDLLHEDQQHFLAKPFTTSELLCMVRNTLGTAATKPASLGAGPRVRRRHVPMNFDGAAAPMAVAKA